MININYFKKLILLNSLLILAFASTNVCYAQEKASNLTLTSPAFKNMEAIPAEYTCEGENISPPLVWSGIPEGTESLALIMDDPDAPGGTWVHWVIYNIPKNSAGLVKNVPARQEMDNGIKQGYNSSEATQYTGPCPPSGTHRYFFKLYALDTKLNLEPGATKEELLRAMNGHVITQTQLVGTYSKD